MLGTARLPAVIGTHVGRSLIFTARNLLRCALGLFLGCSHMVALADDLAASAEHDSGLSWEASYTGEIWRNSGGGESGSEYIDKLELFAAYQGWEQLRWTAFAHVFFGNGRSLSALTQDAMVVSNIESGIDGYQLSEAWIQGHITESSSLKFGFYDLNSEFDVLDSSALFIGSAHGIGMDIGQTGENGPSIFPVTTLGLRLQTEISTGLVLRAAVLDGVPGGRHDTERPSIRLSSEDGALLISELEFKLTDSKILLGAWGYTQETNTLNDSGADENNLGLYLRGERRWLLNDESELAVFGRLGVADSDLNTFARFASAGIQLARPNGHQLGVAVAHAAVSKPLRRRENLDNGETVVELTYVLQIGEYLTIQPNFQYVISPSASPYIDNAKVFGLRISAAIGS